MEQEKIRTHSQKEQETLKSQKQQLAIQWIYLSLRRWFKRNEQKLLVPASK